jgi:hypothetical protein
LRAADKPLQTLAEAIMPDEAHDPCVADSRRRVQFGFQAKVEGRSDCFKSFEFCVGKFAISKTGAATALVQ